MIHALGVKSSVNAVPVALAAVRSVRGILLIKRENPPFAGLWGLPGGKVRYGEHLDEAVRREVLEESGLNTIFWRLRGVVTERLYDGNRLSMHYLLMVCEVFSKSVRFRRSAEGELRWFETRLLSEHWGEIIPSDRLMLEKLVLREPREFYYRCRVRKRGSDYRVERFD